MAGLQSGDGRIMIDSVVWAQYINVTDRQTDSHVAVANAAQRPGIGRQSEGKVPYYVRGSDDVVLQASTSREPRTHSAAQTPSSSRTC